MEFWSVGACPVCASAGDLLALKPIQSNFVFFYCPSCGVAWDEISSVVDNVHSFADFAPCGATRANKADLEREGIESFILVVRDAPEDILIED